MAPKCSRGMKSRRSKSPASRSKWCFEFWMGDRPQSSNCHGPCRSLKRPRAEEKLDDVALVRLQPVELDGGDGAEIQTVDVRRIEQLALPLPVLGDGAAHQRGTNLPDHLFLRAADHAHEWEHELGIGKLACGRIAVNHRGPQVSTAFFFDQPRAES